MACADVTMDIQSEEERLQPEQRAGEVLQYYQASEMVPDVQRPLYDLLQKEPAVLGFVQIASGLFSVFVGIMCAVTLEMRSSLFTLFRLSHLTGVLFIFAGTLSNLLCKYPALLTVSFNMNCGCIPVAMVAACLIIVDLVHSTKDELHPSVEILMLSVVGLEVLMSVILCVWFFQVKHAKSL